MIRPPIPAFLRPALVGMMSMTMAACGQAPQETVPSSRSQDSGWNPFQSAENAVTCDSASAREALRNKVANQPQDNPLLDDIVRRHTDIFSDSEVIRYGYRMSRDPDLLRRVETGQVTEQDFSEMPPRMENFLRARIGSTIALSNFRQDILSADSVSCKANAILTLDGYGSSSTRDISYDVTKTLDGNTYVEIIYIS
jgi:hypothetical protein